MGYLEVPGHGGLPTEGLLTERTDNPRLVSPVLLLHVSGKDRLAGYFLPTFLAAHLALLQVGQADVELETGLGAQIVSTDGTVKLRPGS